jgi:hypothetical protein
VVDFRRSEVIHPKKLVFVCGGKSNGGGLLPTSLREALLGHVTENGRQNQLGDSEVILAETAMNALDQSAFTNLLALEEFIAAVVDAILLIVESPGSMCELGAFVKTSEIREKLIVVMPSDYINDASFIKSGAIRYLKENHSNPQVYGYDWGHDENGKLTVPLYTLKKMAVEIPAAMLSVYRAHEKEAFDEHARGHIIYLTLSFCHLLRGAKLLDLKHCFASAGIQVTETVIRQCLDTLIICKLLKPVTHGKLIYFVAQVARVPLELAWKPGTPNADRDTLRWIGRIKTAIAREDSDRLEIFRRHNVA